MLGDLQPLPLFKMAVLCSQNHRFTEWSGLEGTSVGHLVQPPCRSRVTGPCPGGSWISPEKETPQPPWAACSSAPSPSEWRSSSSSSASLCACCALSCRWAPLKRVWPHPPDTHPWDIYTYLLGPFAAFSSSGWTRCTPGSHWPSWQPENTAGSWSTCHPPDVPSFYASPSSPAILGHILLRSVSGVSPSSISRAMQCVPAALKCLYSITLAISREVMC